MRVPPGRLPAWQTVRPGRCDHPMGGGRYPGYGAAGDPVLVPPWAHDFRAATAGLAGARPTR